MEVVGWGRKEGPSYEGGGGGGRKFYDDILGRGSELFHQSS